MRSNPPIRVVAQALGASALVVLILLLGAAPAWAHAELISTNPPAGSVLKAPPGAMVLTFGEPVEIPLGSMAVLDGAGQKAESGGPYHPEGRANQVAENLPGDLPPGGYVVTWRVISADSHPVHGAFTFIVGSGSAAAASAEASRLRAGEAGSKVVGWVYGSVRSVEYGGVAVFLGGAAVVALAWPEGRRNRLVLRLLRTAWAVGCICSALSIPIQGVYGAGRPLRNVLLPSLISPTLHTRFGQLALARLVVLVFAGGSLMVRLFNPPADRPGATPGRPWLAGAAATSVAVLGTFSLSGHASQGGDALLGVVVDLTHIGAACLWIGGLAVLAVAALDRSAPAPDRTLLRFSQWALVSAAAIAITGTLAAWRQSGSWAALTTTDYGRLVLAKVATFLALAGVGALSRQRVHGRLALPGVPAGGPRPVVAGARPDGPSQVDAIAIDRRVRLRRTVGLELGLAAGILVLTALLVNARPARQAYVPAVSTVTVAGPTKVVVRMPAAAVGVAKMTFQVDSISTGQPLAVPEIDATLSLLGTGSGAVDNLAVQVRSEGAGRYSAVALDVPIPGKWQLNLTVRTDAIDEFYADPVTIRFR